MAGQEYSIVILSSSPPIPDVYAFAPPPPLQQGASSPRRAATLPSSPMNFSPPISPPKNAIAPESQTASIPKTAVRGFATIGNPVRSEHFTILDDDLGTAQPRKQHEGWAEEGQGEESVKKPRKRAVRKTAEDGEKPPSKPRTRKLKANTEEMALGTGKRLARAAKSPYFESEGTATEPQDAPVDNAPKLTKAGKPRKPRAKKEKTGEDPEPKPKRTRAAKPRATKSTKATLQEAPKATDLDVGLNANEAQSIWDVSHSPKKPTEEFLKPKTPGVPEDGLGLEHAVARRQDWTPMKDSAPQDPFTVSAGKENKKDTQCGTDGASFTHMISNFTYESPTARPAPKPAPAAAGVTKRRRVELIDLPENQANTRPSSPDKGKAPKKKQRTITDLVTGQYGPKDPTPDSEHVTSNFFAPRNSAAKVSTDATAEQPQKKAPRQRSKPKAHADGAEPKAKPRARKITKAASKPKTVAEKLLSPQSAALQLKQQDVLFGTSSQLALEEEPEIVRQIQHALKESEKEAESRPDMSLEPPRWPKLGNIRGSRNLWSVSNRDKDGGLLEDREDVYIPEPDRTQDIALLPSSAPVPPERQSDFVDIDGMEPLSDAVSNDPCIPPLSQQASAKVTAQPTELSFYDIDDFDRELPPSNQNAESTGNFPDIDDLGIPVSVETGGSPLKKPRKEMAKPKSQKECSAPLPKPATLVRETEPVPVPKQTPFKDVKWIPKSPSTPPRSAGRFVDIDEILDSEEELFEILSPTPPCEQEQHSVTQAIAYSHEPVFDTSTEHALIQVFRIPTTHLEWVHLKPSVFALITAHIRSIAPTTDPKNPSWHEKILMYDPIVLENFTAHLNGNTNIRTYRRATQKQIKAWNKELKMNGNAVMCIENDDEVLAIKRELEPSMVRDWCQEMSVCCIHMKESRGRGTARKGLY